MVRELEQELMRVRQKHNDVVEFFLGKMQEYGIPEKNLGFVPAKERFK